MKVLPLYDRNDTFLDWALVDDDDFDRAQQYKWRRESYQRKDREPREYAFATINKVRIRLHQFVLGRPEADEDCIDHLNHDGLDDRKVNLRHATGRQNGQNALKPWDSLSEYIGVSLKNDYFFAACGGIYLGQFESDRDAAIAYDHAALQIYGPMALTNGFQSEDVPARVNSRLGRDLPAGVTRTKAKARPFEAKYKKKYLGAFASANEAEAAYVTAKLKDQELIRQKLFSLPVQRNDEGVAIIKLYNQDGTVKRDVLCDDHTWHDLMMYRWYDSSGYCSTTIDQVSIKMHCFLMKSTWIDHRNGDKSDSRFANLRKITRSGNSQNVRRTSADVSEYQGVYTSRAGNRFEAAITCDGVQHYLGSFSTKEAAALAYNRRALELYADPKLNDVDESAVDLSDNGVKTRKGASRFRGVSLNKKRWKTFVQKDKKMRSGGGWMTEEESALAYNFLASKLFQNPKLNQISVDDVKAARQAAFDAFFKVDSICPRGVNKIRNKFVASILQNRKSVILGKFETAREASEVYIEAWMQKNFEAYDKQLPGFSIDSMT